MSEIEESYAEEEESYFPLLVFYTEDTERVDNDVEMVQSPEEIRKGVSFTVLETNTSYDHFGVAHVVAERMKEKYKS